jgi:hypothetical protein
LAFVLISILLGLFTDRDSFYVISLILVLITIVFPGFLYYAAILWFGLSRVLGMITSGLLLSVIFFAIVTPVALFRKISGKDRLGLKGFRKDRSSLFVDRFHHYVPEDLTHPF